MKQLTPEDWKQTSLPIHWLKIEGLDDPAKIGMIEKYLDAYTHGWWYTTGSFYFFEKKSDRTLFKLWLTEKLPQNDGTI